MDYNIAYNFEIDNNGEPIDNFKNYQIKSLENTIKLLEYLLEKEKLEVIRLRKLINCR
jgi:hypothetical protein